MQTVQEHLNNLFASFVSHFRWMKQCMQQHTTLKPAHPDCILIANSAELTARQGCVHMDNYAYPKRCETLDDQHAFHYE